jgi:type II secretory ATPase GspE/PulE/Tfp pilus assembly ATPase PilB-like protein
MQAAKRAIPLRGKPNGNADTERLSKVGELLLEKKLVTAGSAAKAYSIIVQIENHREQHGVTFRQAARHFNYIPSKIDQNDLAKVLAEVFKHKFLEKIDPEEVDEELISKFGINNCLEATVLFLKGGIPVIAEPSKPDIISAIEKLLRDRPAYYYVSTPEEIQRAVAVYVDTDLERQKFAEMVDEEAEKILNHVLQRALDKKVTDIHIEPDGVRTRVDGVLQPIQGLTLSKEKLEKLNNVIGNKAEWDTNADASGHFKDGSWTWQSLKDTQEEVDIRVSYVETIDGGSTVLRLLVRDDSLDTLESLGYSQEEQDILSRIKEAPNGMILLCGPTGSGKTTTIASFLKALQDPSVKGLSCENPVEIKIRGIRQVQFNDKAGVTFKKAMKYFLRQDPDFIFIGEIRDPDTAAVAVEAALTGHLMFTTLHTMTVIHTLSRLEGLGVKRDNFSFICQGIIAQRLVRKLCKKCKIQAPIEQLGLNDLLTNRLRGLGLKQAWMPKQEPDYKCPICKGTGYRGRTAVCEILEVTGERGDLLARETNLRKLQNELVNTGFVTIAENGIKKAIEGVTSLREVHSIVGLNPWAHENRKYNQELEELARDSL